MLKHTSKRLLFKQNYKKKLFEVEHLIYNQWYSQSKSDTDFYDSRISKIWTLIRNFKWTFDAEQFQQSLALVNCCMSLHIQTAGLHSFI